MERLRALTLPGYLIGAILVTFPLIDSLVTIYPFRLGEVAWRFGAAGLMSRALLTPLLGLFLLIAIGLMANHRRTLRVISVATIVLALLVIGGMALFGLDALQMRTQIRPELSTAFDSSTAVALIKYTLGVVVLLILGIGTWRATARAERRTRSTSKERELLVGARPVETAAVES